MSMKKKVDGQNKRKRNCMSMNKSGRTPKKKKKFDDEVTFSHVGKSMTQSRRTKYLKNGTLIEDYNASRMLEVRVSRITGAVYQWPTVQKDAQSYI